ncbi:MAG TPA: phospholipase D-like domain-containing protein [Candidatus Gastranaerophilaceae bacterium]|nr:phospholipase D-like domain-containing protein [Candidatus Gastranaerophilaceae bacterium]HPT41647.1 phospholipase D-like domain-containing protein [Candidatus Gastranaerophilaceae bacterium]
MKIGVTTLAVSCTGHSFYARKKNNSTDTPVNSYGSYFNYNLSSLAFCANDKRTLTTEKSFINPIKPQNAGKLTTISDITQSMSDYINIEAYKSGLTNDAFLRKKLKGLHVLQVEPVESKTAIVGNTRVQTLIDGEQIFGKTLDYLKSAQESILIEMFEFQNLTVDGNKWAQNGAERVGGAREQQQILWTLIKKRQANPNMKIQVILDAHKWYIDGNGNRVRHYANQDMIKFLKKNGIDVVPYPRGAQQGTLIQHIKLLVVDGKKAVLGGMNWGSHSPANHDACVAIETLPKKKNSEVDNIIEEHFNRDWKFAWQRLGETKFVAGPLTQKEQKYYHGIDKRIKQENVDYEKLLGEFYNTPEAKTRYKKGTLDLVHTNPVDDPQMEILGTKPKEFELIGDEGTESTRRYLENKLLKCKKLRAELFVFTDYELIEIIIDRVKKGELDAQIIVSSDILESFPPCRKGYIELKKNNIPVRLYKTDKRIRQRLHSKWAVFDDNEVLIGSTNWSQVALNQNLETGRRYDYDRSSKKIDDEIKQYFESVKGAENDLNLPHLSWNGSVISYEALKQRKRLIRGAINRVTKDGSAQIEINKTKLSFSKKDLPKMQKVHAYYTIIQERHNAKVKYKRGNNELTIVFKSPSLAKSVFEKQFDRDWKHSESEYEKLSSKVFEPKGKN